MTNLLINAAAEDVQFVIPPLVLTMSLFLLQQLKGVQFEISPLAAEGVFQVNAKLLGVQLERVELSLQVGTRPSASH